MSMTKHVDNNRLVILGRGKECDSTLQKMVRKVLEMKKAELLKSKSL